MESSERDKKSSPLYCVILCHPCGLSKNIINTDSQNEIMHALIKQQHKPFRFTRDASWYSHGCECVCVILCFTSQPGQSISPKGGRLIKETSKIVTSSWKSLLLGPVSSPYCHNLPLPFYSHCTTRCVDFLHQLVSDMIITAEKTPRYFELH